MSYNVSGYNHLPFNLSGFSGNIIYVNGEGFENVNSLAGVGRDYYLFVISAERVLVKLEATRLILPQLPSDPEREPREAIGFMYDIIGQYWFTVSGSESISSETDFSAAIFIENAAHVEEVKQKSSISCIRCFEGESEEQVSLASAEFCAETYIYPPEGRELVSAVTSVEAIDEIVCTLNVTVKPGERLIMNSDTYLVLLNGENVIEVHEGEWFDKLTRQTVGYSIKANAGQESLTARVMYTEKYL